MLSLVDTSRLPLVAELLLLAIAFSCIVISWRPSKHQQNGVANEAQKRGNTQQQPSKDSYYSITPLVDFDWRVTNPIQLRPFKPKYHLTMALENTTLSDLVEMDKTYLDRITLRRQLIKAEGRHVVAANESIKPGVDELYKWMVGVYLPRRFPTMFKIGQASGVGQPVLRNLVTDEDISLQPPPNVVDALSVLGGHVDNEFLLLRPSSDPADEGKYRLEGFVTCFPSGFDTFAKLNLKLADIHTPVPGYAAKIEKSMDRFFAAVPIGKIVKRHNWSITTNSKLYSLGGNHLYEGEEGQKLRMEDLDFEQTVMRCERQTLHRLPENNDVLVFAFKTYQYPLRQLKEEGCGAELAKAIDGLAGGSVPKMAFYKRQVVWGDAVKEYLRS